MGEFKEVEIVSEEIIRDIAGDPFFVLDVGKMADGSAGEVLRTFKNVTEFNMDSFVNENILMEMSKYSMPFVPEYFTQELRTELNLICGKYNFNVNKENYNFSPLGDQELHWNFEDFYMVHESQELTVFQKYFILKNYEKLYEEYYDFQAKTFKVAALNIFIKNYLTHREKFFSEFDSLSNSNEADLLWGGSDRILSLLLPKFNNYNFTPKLITIITVIKSHNVIESLNEFSLKRIDDLINYFHYKLINASYSNSMTFKEFRRKFPNGKTDSIKFNLNLKDDSFDLFGAKNYNIYSDMAVQYLTLEKYNSPLIELYEKLNPMIIDGTRLKNSRIIMDSINYENEYLIEFVEKTLEAFTSTENNVAFNDITTINLDDYAYPNCKSYLPQLGMYDPYDFYMKDTYYGKLYFEDLINIDYYFWRYSKYYPVEHLIEVVSHFNGNNYDSEVFNFNDFTYGARLELVEEILSSKMPMEWVMELRI